ncbi:MAG: FitA-like ribbon-helix-helix domain-containing protein [bacterium]
MKSITIRGIDPELDKKLKQTAAERSKSVNQLLLEILRKDLGLQKKKKFTKIYKDLDHLFGKWKEEEFQDIQNKIGLERKIDKELW